MKCLMYIDTPVDSNTASGQKATTVFPIAFCLVQIQSKGLLLISRGCPISCNIFITQSFSWSMMHLMKKNVTQERAGVSSF